MKLYGQLLEKVLEYKYLGVVFTCDHSWSTHVDKIVNKSRKLAGML